MIKPGSERKPLKEIPDGEYFFYYDTAYEKGRKLTAGNFEVRPLEFEQPQLEVPAVTTRKGPIIPGEHSAPYYIHRKVTAPCKTDNVQILHGDVVVTLPEIVVV
ncbi:MAG: hypothetical protein RLY57_720 [Candidatus Parcubacteria bacterium]|jgi:hypothetical protein